MELSFLRRGNAFLSFRISKANDYRMFLRGEIRPQGNELQIMMKPKIKYADYMRAEEKLNVRDFERLQRREILNHFEAYRLLGMSIPSWSAHQIIDGKRRQYFSNRPNKYLSNLFAILAASWGHTVTGIGNFVTTGGTISTGTGTNDYLNLTEADANSMLGTDTSTTTIRGMWELVSAITHTAASISASHNYQSVTQQSKTYNQMTSTNFAQVYAASATSGNPTIGEVAADASINGTDSGNLHVSRLAAADGVFSSFTLNSAGGITFNYLTTWPT